jgi:hypothetical protein
MSRLLIEIIIGLVLTGGFYGWWVYHDHVEQKQGIEKQVKTDQAAAAAQKAKDDQILATTQATHAKEISDLKQAYLTPVTSSATHVVCYKTSPGSVPDPDVHNGSSAAPAVVQANPGLHPDISPALYLLAERADQLSADARQLEQETHAGH